MDFAILDFSFLVSRVWACAHGLVGVGARRRVGVGVGVACGGGRASIGVRAQLRFGDVLNLPIGELEGGFCGSLMLGNIGTAEGREKAFKRVFCALWVRTGKREGIGPEWVGVNAKKGPLFRGAPCSGLRVVMFAELLSRLPSRNRQRALVAPCSVWQTTSPLWLFQKWHKKNRKGWFEEPSLSRSGRGLRSLVNPTFQRVRSGV